MNEERKTIIADDRDDVCYICGHNNPTDVHHMMHGTANRRLADNDELTVHLCRDCHDKVHKAMLGYDDMLKGIAQSYYERTHSRGEWMRMYGKNYL